MPMPRLTTIPGPISRAAPLPMSSLVSTSSPTPGGRRARRRRAPLDPLPRGPYLDDTIHEQPGEMDVVGVEVPGRDELFDLDDRRAGRHGHRGVEVARAEAEAEVAVRIRPPRVDERDVGGERGLQQVPPPVELAHLSGPAPLDDLAVRPVALGEAAGLDVRAGSGRREERGDAVPARPQPLRERALRGELDLDLAGQEAPLQVAVAADVGRDDA